MSRERRIGADEEGLEIERPPFYLLQEAVQTLPVHPVEGTVVLMDPNYPFPNPGRVNNGYIAHCRRNGFIPYSELRNEGETLVPTDPAHLLKGGKFQRIVLDASNHRDGRWLSAKGLLPKMESEGYLVHEGRLKLLEGRSASPGGWPSQGYPPVTLELSRAVIRLSPLSAAVVPSGRERSHREEVGNWFRDLQRRAPRIF